IELHYLSHVGYEHTSTWSNINGTVRNSCNHGNCASTITYRMTCSGTAGVDYHEFDTTLNSPTSPACTTPYNWNSTGGGHNCHDDSVRQIWGMEYGPQGASNTGVCNNTASHWYGPTSCTISSW